MSEPSITDSKALVEKAQKAVDSILPIATITSQPTYHDAQESLLEIKKIGKNIKAWKDSVIKPIQEGIKNFKMPFIPIEEQLETREKDIKDEQKKYLTKLEAERVKREKETEEKLKQGVSMNEATKGLHSTTDRLKELHTRKIPKVRIDEKKLPKEYWIPDESRIKTFLLDGGKIEGVELYYELIPVGR